MRPAWLRFAVPVLAALALSAPSRAQNAPGPCPTLRRPPIEARVLPLEPCESSPVSFAFIHTCCTRVSIAAASPHVVLDVVTQPDSCTNLRCIPDTLFVPLGRFAAGNHTFTIEYLTEWIEDGTSCVSETRETIAFTVRTECPPPTGIYFLERVDIGRGHQQTCPGDSIPVRLAGTIPDNCTTFERVEVIPSPALSASPFGAPPTLRVIFSAPSCLGRPCVLMPVPWAATVKIPALIPRDWRLPVEALAIDTCVPDTTKLGANAFPFRVLESCTDPPPAGCLLPSWDHPGTEHCDTFIGPGHDAQLTLKIGTEAPLAALQGTIAMYPRGLRIKSVEAIGPAGTMHLSWNHVSDGVRFVLFSSNGAPIPGGTLPELLHVPVLRITFGQDAVDPGAPRTRVLTAGLLGADAQGQAVYYCPTFAPIDEAAYICRTTPCDFNGDGVADVRDLIRMVRCLTKRDTCEAETTRLFDCDASGAFDLDDVICCARTILRLDPQPHDEQDREASLRVSMGAPATADGAFEIPVEISGNAAVGAARLALRIPDGPFETIEVRTEPGAPWLAVHEAGAGRVTVGMIALGAPAAPAAPLRFTLRLEPRPGASPSGEVALESADFAAPDGVRLITDPGAPSVVIGVGDHIELSAASPNPFRESLQFSVTLPVRTEIEVSVFDLSGRRVRRMHQGTLPGGTHAFVWDGKGENGARAPGGIYFYRVRGAGVTLSRRAVLLRGGS